MGQENLGWVTGLSLANFLQFMSMEEKTCKLGIQSQKKEWGDFYFDNGRLFHAFYEGVDGEEAAMAMLRLKDMKIWLRSMPDERPEVTIRNELMAIIMKSSIAEDHDNAMIAAPRNGKKRSEQGKGEKELVQTGVSLSGIEDGRLCQDEVVKGMVDIERELQELGNAEGFMAVGVFSPQGGMISEYNPTGQRIAQISALANDVLLASQKATEIMGVGRGNMIHIETPEAQVIACCLNETTDGAVTKKGKAYFYMVLVMKKEGNIVMGKAKMKGLIKELGVCFR